MASMDDLLVTCDFFDIQAGPGDCATCNDSEVQAWWVFCVGVSHRAPSIASHNTAAPSTNRGPMRPIRSPSIETWR